MKSRKKPPRFLADHMNGELAKWLRIMGFDCLYPETSLNDKKIVELCEEEGRILLTRDKELHSLALRRGLNSILIRSNYLIDKFKEIYSIINLNEYLNLLTPRCTICNTQLILTDPKRIIGETTPPLYEDIKKKYETVYYCEKCGKIYWEGTHWNNISRTINEIKKLGKSQKS